MSHSPNVPSVLCLRFDLRQLFLNDVGLTGVDFRLYCFFEDGDNGHDSSHTKFPSAPAVLDSLEWGLTAVDAGVNATKLFVFPNKSATTQCCFLLSASSFFT